MATLSHDPFSHMFQIMSSFNSSPQDIFSSVDPDLASKTMSWQQLMQTLDIEDFKTVLDKAEAICKQNAEVTPRKPSPTQRADLERINKVASEQAMSDRFQCVLKSNIGKKQHYSATPIKELTSIPLRDMFAPKIHKGRYLICRTILQAVRQLSLQLGIEDPHGQTILVTVARFPGLFLANSESLEAHFPLGTVMAIREPWMTFCDGSNGLTSKEGIISVESPSDIVFLEPSDPILADVTWSTTPSVYRHTSTTEQWKNLGTKYFHDNRFMPAAIAWSRGLERDRSIHSLRLNRCQAYIRLEWFSAALADALYVLSSPGCQADITTKACYRAACAEYGMGYYSEALSRLEVLRDKDDNDLKSLMNRCRKRMKETTAGEYAWSEMFTAGQATVPHLDVAEFVSPAISVASFSTRRGGRGIRATRDIKPGELLVVAKPFASVFPAELPSNNHVYAVNFEAGRTDGTTFLGLINRVLTRLHGSPDESNLIYHLYDGRSLPKLPTTYPPPRASGTHTVTPLVWNADVDITKIDRIITYNAFTPVAVGVVTKTVEQLPSPQHEIHTPSAIYALPSIFNHSCHPNATWHCFGDVMVIRARETIPQGSEITLSYIIGTRAYHEDNSLKAALQQPCDCVMHTSDRADGEALLRKREMLVKDICTKLANSQREDAEALLKKLESTYRLPQHVPRPLLFYPCNAAMAATELDARRSHSLELHRLSIEHAFKALKAAGFIMLDTNADEEHRHILPISKDCIGAWAVGHDACILIMIRISASFISLSEKTRAERWLRAAWWVHDTAFGGGKALFDLRFGTLLDSMSVPSIDYGWE